ncbi:MAG: hypothetical protein RLZZ414_1289 [Bacteroidota bacterium]|jgi:hypothetical protein
MIQRLSIAILFLTLLFSCESEQNNNPKLEFYVSYGDSLSLIAMDTVKHELMGAIEKYGHVEAINYCKNYIGDIVQNQKPNNVHIKRTSLKYRNPNNAPDSLEFVILNKYQKIKAEGGDLLPQLIQINNTTHYFKPIVVQQACLSCHGQSEISKEVFQKIQKEYPKDLATGYQFGDVRGVWHIIMH